MFKLVTHKECVKAKPTDRNGMWVERTSLVRDDGVLLENIGSGPEMEDFFRYSDNAVSFELTARRYDLHLRPTDTWDVDLGLALKKFSPSSDGPINPEKAREIARNIEEALKAWPSYPSEPPIQRVKISMKFWPLWPSAWGDTP